MLNILSCHLSPARMCPDNRIDRGKVRRRRFRERSWFAVRSWWVCRRCCWTAKRTRHPRRWCCQPQCPIWKHDSELCIFTELEKRVQQFFLTYAQCYEAFLSKICISSETGNTNSLGIYGWNNKKRPYKKAIDSSRHRTVFGWKQHRLKFCIIWSMHLNELHMFVKRRFSFKTIYKTAH